MTNPLVADLTPTRQRILDAARELFWSQGYARTSLRAISESLGLSKAALYYHFQAKDEILLAIVVALLDRIDEVMSATGPSLASAAQRRAFLALYLDELISQPATLALLRDPAVVDHPLGQRFSAQHARIARLLGATDDPASLIRTTTALWALEFAVVEFGRAQPAELRDTALRMALAVLES